MAQVADIRKYLIDDTIFNKTSRRFISINSDYVKDNNQRLDLIFDKLIKAMRQQSPLFDRTFQKIIWAGSYYKGTRIGQPEEYDLNFVINLPFRERDIEFSADRPGYIKLHMAWRNGKLPNNLNLNPSAYRELRSFIDDQLYLNQEKFRNWMERILHRVANATGEKSRIIFDGYTPIRIRKSGPAFTLKFQFLNSEKEIDIDVVPVLLFSTRKLPPKCSKMNILEQSSNKCWSVVPKPLNKRRGGFNDPLHHRYWRLCFYEFEKAMLCSRDYGRMKPVIRQLKKLRDTQKWKNVASYYLETLCYHEKEMFHISNSRSLTSLFFTMLEKLHDAFRNGRITYYWDDNLNLLENIEPEEMRNMQGRLNNVLQKIRRTIINDKYAIAKWVLNSNELIILKGIEHTIMPEGPESEPEPEPEFSNQGHCVII